MRILRAVGLGLAILIIKFLVPEIFHGIEETLLMFFDTAQLGLAQVQTGLNNIPF